MCVVLTFSLVNCMLSCDVYARARDPWESLLHKNGQSKHVNFSFLRWTYFICTCLSTCFEPTCRCCESSAKLVPKPHLHSFFAPFSSIENGSALAGVLPECRPFLLQGVRQCAVIYTLFTLDITLFNRPHMDSYVLNFKWLFLFLISMEESR